MTGQPLQAEAAKAISALAKALGAQASSNDALSLVGFLLDMSAVKEADSNASTWDNIFAAAIHQDRLIQTLDTVVQRYPAFSTKVELIKQSLNTGRLSALHAELVGLQPIHAHLVSSTHHLKETQRVQLTDALKALFEQTPMIREVLGNRAAATLTSRIRSVAIAMQIYEEHLDRSEDELSSPGVPMGLQTFSTLAIKARADLSVAVGKLERFRVKMAEF
jgi:hypothetical protein